MLLLLLEISRRRRAWRWRRDQCRRWRGGAGRGCIVRRRDRLSRFSRQCRPWNNRAADNDRHRLHITEGIPEQRVPKGVRVTRAIRWGQRNFVFFLSFAVSKNRRQQLKHGLCFISYIVNTANTSTRAILGTFLNDGTPSRGRRTPKSLVQSRSRNLAPLRKQTFQTKACSRRKIFSGRRKTATTR